MQHCGHSLFERLDLNRPDQRELGVAAVKLEVLVHEVSLADESISSSLKFDSSVATLSTDRPKRSASRQYRNLPILNNKSFLTEF